MFVWIRTHPYISVAGIVILAVAGFGFYRVQQPKTNSLVTASVERRNVEQIVSVVGAVDMAERVKLSVRRSGPVVAIRHKVGDRVRANDSIIEMKSIDEQLSLQQANAQLKKAQADLQARVAGESSESLAALAATTAQRAAEFKKAQDDLVAVKNDQQIIIRTQQQLVADALTNVKLSAQSGITVASTALNDADGILGVDIETANQAFRENLAVKDPAALMIAKDRYRFTKDARAQAIAAFAISTPQDTAVSVGFLLDRATDLLTSVSRVLETSITNDALPPTTLSAKQSSIATDRTAVNTAQINLQSKLQSLYAAKLTQESALNDASTAITTKQNALAVAQAVLESAKAAEQAKRVPPRAVDIAALEALVAQSQSQVSQARQTLEDAVVRSPVDGVISDIGVKIGEVVAVNQTIVEILGGALEIKANIPEVDIGKVKVGQKAAMTLDAFGSAETFAGAVVSVDPAQTVVEGVATYIVTLVLDKADGRIKPGMTANIEMVTDSRMKVLVIPQRAVRAIEGKKTVKVRSSMLTKDVAVTTGLLGSDGYVEVLSGVNEEDLIVVSGE